MTILRRERCCHFAAHVARAWYLVNPHDLPAARGLQFNNSRSIELLSKDGVHKRQWVAVAAVLAGDMASARLRQSAEFAARSGFAQHKLSAISRNRPGRLLRFVRRKIKPEVAILSTH
jgi:hypothetical protein